MSLYTMWNIILCSLLVVVPGFTLSLKVNDYDPRYGTYVGNMKTLMHRVNGDVYAVDATTIFVKGFSYDGEAPDAFFFAGNNSPKPTNKGFVIPNERGNKYPLNPYNNRDIVLKFPVTKKGQRSFHDIKWISIWCKEFGIDFGHVVLPEKMQVPSPYAAGKMSSKNDQIVVSNVIMKDTSTFELEDFQFDGSVPDAIFVMGSGAKNEDGFQVADEKGSMSSLNKASTRRMTLKVPKLASGKHVQYFGVWSPTKGMLASVTFPNDMRVPPHSKIPKF